MKAEVGQRVYWWVDLRYFEDSIKEGVVTYVNEYMDTYDLDDGSHFSGWRLHATREEAIESYIERNEELAVGYEKTAKMVRKETEKARREIKKARGANGARQGA